jgi:hypothetical protein
MVDDEHIHRARLRFQFESELILQRREDGSWGQWVKRAGKSARLGTRTYLGRKLKIQIKKTAQPRPIHYRPV